MPTINFTAAHAHVFDQSEPTVQSATETPRLTLIEFEQRLNEWENAAPREHADRVALSEKFRQAYNEPSKKDIYIGIPRRALNITSLPEDIIGQLQHLEKITISLPALSEFPPLTQPIPNLKKLFLNKCTQLSTLPENFSQLFPNLENLSCLATTNLVVNSHHLQSLHHLTSLNLARTQSDFLTLRHELPNLQSLIHEDGSAIVADAVRITNLFRIAPEAGGERVRQPPDPAEIEKRLAEIPASEVWPKADFDDYMKKVWSECVPTYFSKEDVFAILDAAFHSSTLRDQISAIALSADLKRCVDNRLRTFNDMQIAVRIGNIFADHSLSEMSKADKLLDVLGRHYRNHLLSVFSENEFKCNKELLEIELYLRLRLKGELNLPCPVNSMKHIGYAEQMLAPAVGAATVDQVKVKEALAMAKEFVLKQEKDQEALALWLLENINWVAWIKPKISTTISEIEKQFNLKIEALDETFSQLSEEEQDEKLIAFAEEKQVVEAQCIKEKYDLMLKKTLTIMAEVKAQQSTPWFRDILKTFTFFPFPRR